MGTKGTVSERERGMIILQKLGLSWEYDDYIYDYHGNDDIILG